MAKNEFSLRIVTEEYNLPNGVALKIRTHAFPKRNRVGRTIGATPGSAICRVYLVMKDADPELWRMDEDHTYGQVIEEMSNLVHALGCHNQAVIDGLANACLSQIHDIQRQPSY